MTCHSTERHTLNQEILVDIDWMTFDPVICINYTCAFIFHVQYFIILFIFTFVEKKIGQTCLTWYTVQWQLGSKIEIVSLKETGTIPEYDLLKPFTFVVRQYASSCLLITCKRDYKKCTVIPYKKFLFFSFFLNTSDTIFGQTIFYKTKADILLE